MTKYYQPQYVVKCNLGKVKTQDNALYSITNIIGQWWSWAFAGLVLIYRAFLEVTNICSCCLCMPQLQPFLLPALLFLWMSFKGKISADFSINLSFSLVMVSGGCCSHGRHGYHLGCLAAPLGLTRHLPHTLIVC